MKEIIRKFIVKEWNELSSQEKENAIKQHQESIYLCWDDLCYEQYKQSLEELKTNLKYITFDDLYVDDNSQGFWIDKVKGFRVNIDENQNNSIENVDLKIRKFIEDIEYIDFFSSPIGKYVYLTPQEALETKGFKRITKKLLKDFETFKNGINNIVKTYYDTHYDVPQDFVNDYMNDLEFEYELKSA